jgi:NTE family protein
VTAALVLGGGGVTGVAWELGVLLGLAERGVDLTGADRVIGTSAGSVVGAQVATGVDVRERWSAQLAPPDGEIAASFGAAVWLRLVAAAVLGPPAPDRMRARIGRYALQASRVPEEARRAVIAARLPVHEWPERDLRLVAVDTADGRSRVFDRAAGVPLVDAVAASCAVPGVWPPVTVDGRRYMDGGVRSVANADLAAGADRIVVIAPLVAGIGPLAPVPAQVERLRAGGAAVALVEPDPAALEAIGRNVLDPARRAAAAYAGRAQGRAAADVVGDTWIG